MNYKQYIIKNGGENTYFKSGTDRMAANVYIDGVQKTIYTDNYDFLDYGVIIEPDTTYPYYTTRMSIKTFLTVKNKSTGVLYNYVTSTGMTVNTIVTLERV